MIICVQVLCLPIFYILLIMYLGVITVFILSNKYCIIFQSGYTSTFLATLCGSLNFMIPPPKFANAWVVSDTNHCECEVVCSRRFCLI